MKRAAFAFVMLHLAVGSAPAQGVVNRQIQMNHLIQPQQIESQHWLKQRLLDLQKQPKTHCVTTPRGGGMFQTVCR
jgi:hypothetical protein